MEFYHQQETAVIRTLAQYVSEKYRHKDSVMTKLEYQHNRLLNVLPKNILEMNVGEFLDTYENDYD